MTYPNLPQQPLIAGISGQLKTIMDAQAVNPNFSPLPQLPGATRVSQQRMRQREALGLDALPEVRGGEG